MRQPSLTNWGSFALLQIRENFITNWGNFIITNWDKLYYKLGQLSQLGQLLLQNRAAIANEGRTWGRLGQVLQIRVNTTSWGITPSCTLSGTVFYLVPSLK